MINPRKAQPVLRATLYSLPLVYLLAAAETAVAQESNTWMSVGLAVEHTDNIDRIEAGGRDETTISGLSEFQITASGRRYDLLLDGVLNYSTFQNDTSDDEFRGNAFSELVLNVAGEGVQWITQDNFGQVRRVVTAPDTPDNRENINVFRTGPRLATRLGQRGALSLQAFYQRSQYEDSLQDSDSLAGVLVLGRTISPRTDLSLNLSARQVEFDESELFNDYDINEAYFGWTTAGARTRLEFEAGYTEVSEDTNDENGSLFRLQLARDVSSRSRLTFDARTELTTSEDAFRFTQQLGRPELTTQAQGADAEPFRLNFFGLAWQTTGDRLALNAEVSFDSREFIETTTEDRERALARVGATRTLSGNFALGVFAEYSDESFDNEAEDFDEFVVGLRMDFRPIRRMQVAAVVSRVDRSTDVQNLSFEETLARLTITYDVFGDRSLADRRRLGR
ncbi:MAG: hypothetical protein AAFX56_09905 [Pseudomonadota bacterium]